MTSFTFTTLVYLEAYYSIEYVVNQNFYTFYI